MRSFDIDRNRGTFLDMGMGYVWTTDRDFKFTYVSPAVELVLGFNVADMIGTNALEGMAESTKDQIRHFVSIDSFTEENDRSDLNPVLTFDAQRYHKNGSCCHLRVSVTVLRDINGRPVGTIGASRDITEAEHSGTAVQKNRRAFDNAIVERTVEFMRLGEELKIEITRRSRLEAELRETEEQYRFLFEEAPMAIDVEDRSEFKRYCEKLRESGVTDFRQYFKDNPDEVVNMLSMATVVSLNRECRRQLQVNSLEEMNQKYLMIVATSGEGERMLRERAVMTAEAALHGINFLQGELATDAPDGGRRLSIGTFKVFPGYEDTWERVWVSAMDITDLKRAQASLHESENRFKSIFQAAEDAIFIKDRDRKYTHVNPAMLRLLSMEEEDIIGKTYEEVFAERSSASLKQLDERVLSGESIETEQTVPTPSGPITLNFLRFPIVAAGGEVIGTCGIARDVTPRRAVNVRSRRDPDSYPSRAMQLVGTQLRSAAESDTTVLFLGESGVGKDYLARYLHDKSWRSGGPFMSINCAALAPKLVESELFGHEHGAFTGAIRRKRGLLELAEGGTIFLNEIAELSQLLQAKLLTFLDTRSFTRVGGEQSLTVNARIVAATNKDLKTEVLAGTFREDLYFRLSVFPISIPPLRERLEDLDLLVTHIIEDLMNSMTILEPPAITPGAIGNLRRYGWPGNIRELRNVLERAVIMSDKKKIRSRDLKIVPDGEVPLSVADTLTTRLVLDDGGSLSEALRKVEKTLIRKALQLSAGNVTRAAQKIGITRSQLKYRMRSLGIARRGKTDLNG